MVITSEFIEVGLAGKIWAGKESSNGFLPKPSLDRARTAPGAGVCLLTGKKGTGSELGVTGSGPVPPANKKGFYLILVCSQPRPPFFCC